MEQNELPFDPCHLGGPSGVAIKISLAVVHLDQNELPFDLCHLGDPLSATKMIFEPTARSAQVVHLSCIKIGTISKETETSFHLTHVT
jgi:hypothetical protein